MIVDASAFPNSLVSIKKVVDESFSETADPDTENSGCFPSFRKLDKNRSEIRATPARSRGSLLHELARTIYVQGSFSVLLSRD